MTNDKQRERLVELIESHKYWCVPDELADYLLANGVVVPPYQIGETVYVIIENMPFFHAGVYECEVEWYSFGKDGLRPTVKVKSDNIINGANLELYLEDIFASREEAEQALVTDNNVGSKKKEEGVQG